MPERNATVQQSLSAPRSSYSPTSLPPGRTTFSPNQYHLLVGLGYRDPFVERLQIAGQALRRQTAVNNTRGKWQRGPGDVKVRTLGGAADVHCHGDCASKFYSNTSSASAHAPGGVQTTRVLSRCNTKRNGSMKYTPGRLLTVEWVLIPVLWPGSPWRIGRLLAEHSTREGDDFVRAWNNSVADALRTPSKLRQ